MQNITVLGSTGSIGISTLDVVARHPERYKVIGLSAHRNIDLLVEQVRQFRPLQVAIADPTAATLFETQFANEFPTLEILQGDQGLIELASNGAMDMLMAAIVGAAGLLPTLTAVDAGKKILLANKESLVMSGELFMEKARKSGATILPIDSEHNAIFQSLPAELQHQPQQGLKQSGVQQILLTGSGGPFLTIPLEQLSQVTPEQACKHPNWSMGQKISVDSATMMNKGLEFIEAKWLFHTHASNIQVVIHPQSIIHSMVRYNDGSVLAQMGNPDMRTPIAHAMAFPERIESGVEPLDFFNIADFSFCQPDYKRFPNLKLAIDACEQGQAATTALNAANEVAVAAFLSGKIKFTDIYRINETILTVRESISASSLQEVLAIDQWARAMANEQLEKLN